MDAGDEVECPRWKRWRVESRKNTIFSLPASSCNFIPPRSFHFAFKYFYSSPFFPLPGGEDRFLLRFLSPSPPLKERIENTIISPKKFGCPSPTRNSFNIRIIPRDNRRWIINWKSSSRNWEWKSFKKKKKEKSYARIFHILSLRFQRRARLSWEYSFEWLVKLKKKKRKKILLILNETMQK